MLELGSCTMYITAKNFLEKTEEQFIKTMSDNYSRVSEDIICSTQIRAWKDSFLVLQNTIRELPEQWRKDLWMVFEYVLPTSAPGTRRFENEKHSRSDVILLTRKKAIVLEFKQSDEPFIGHFRQTGKYKRRLRRFHTGSRDMWIYSVLVLTKAVGYRQRKERVIGCSPDRLTEVLLHVLGNGAIDSCNCRSWINSGFVGDQGRA